ncbi:MAG TPA: hypothetical protein VNW15_08335 [Rhizomicrobium sp.]|jgi:hypothetical protein|nr:hypothetical protein [Rhizomicrobium sp.]
MTEEKQKERPEYGTHWGDWGVIVIAFVFFMGFLGLMFGPSPLKGIEKFDAVADKIKADIIAKAEKENRQKAIEAAEATGVVDVGIAPPKKH